jgi:hypothetical protein
VIFASQASVVTGGNSSNNFLQLSFVSIACKTSVLKSRAKVRHLGWKLETGRRKNDFLKDNNNLIQVIKSILKVHFQLLSTLAA